MRCARNLQTAMRCAAGLAHLATLEDLLVHENAECDDDTGIGHVDYSV